MNAIILAAGMGTRMRPLTDDRPKCMVVVGGTPIIERQIRYLHEAGIRDITLVSGYKAEALEPLREKYGVDIVFNDRFDTCNNIYSLYLVRDRMSDTFVVEGDVFMTENPFLAPAADNRYYGVYREGFRKEWQLVTDPDSRLLEVRVGDGDGVIMSGVSHWMPEASRRICDEITRLVETQPHDDLFWDDAVLHILPQLSISVSPVSGLHEIDTVAERDALERRLLAANICK